MKNTYRSILTVGVLATALSCGTSIRANAASATPLVGSPGASQDGFQFVEFRNSAEAEMLRRAYRILATGDHDYDGHRVKAMHEIEAAGKLLDMDLGGDLKDRTPQALSDDKLLDAKGLIVQVQGAAEVKDQKKITRHLTEAIHQIDTALKKR